MIARPVVFSALTIVARRVTSGCAQTFRVAARTVTCHVVFSVLTIVTRHVTSRCGQAFRVAACTSPGSELLLHGGGHVVPVDAASIAKCVPCDVPVWFSPRSGSPRSARVRRPRSAHVM
jgi:hypothetical protein